MSTQTNINNLQTDKSAQLLLEVGKNHVAFFSLQEQEVKALGFYHFEDSDAFQKILNSNETLNFSYNKVDVVFGNEEATLIPSSLHKINDDKFYLESLFGSLPETRIHTALNFNHQIHVVYATPKEVLEALENKFRSLNVHHQYSCLLTQRMEQENQLQVIVYPNSFVLVVIKDDNVQLLNQYNYFSADDVAYVLLKASETYGLGPEAVNVVIRGMVEKDSAFCKTLHQYFGHLSFGETIGETKLDNELQQYPKHYFSYLYNYLQCV